MDTLRWRHNDHDGVSNPQPRGCLLNRLFTRKSKKTSKLRVTGLCAGNSPGPVDSPHKGPVTRKMLPFDDVIMKKRQKKFSGSVGNQMTSFTLPDDTKRNLPVLHTGAHGAQTWSWPCLHILAQLGVQLVHYSDVIMGAMASQITSLANEFTYRGPILITYINFDPYIDK